MITMPTITEINPSFENPFDDDDKDEECPLVEVTLLSIKGITFRTHDVSTNIMDFCHGEVNGRGPTIPSITAAVAFSGSAHDMQVSSSFVCPKSGNLMVESYPAQLLPPTDYSRTGSFPMIAQWTDSNDDDLIKQHLQPHLSIRVPSSDSRLPKIPLSCMNRDSNIIKASLKSPSRHPPSLDDSDVSAQSGEMGGFEVDPDLSLEECTSEIRGGASVVWSASGAAMPEIIELHVSLKIDEYEPKNRESADSDDVEFSSVWRDTIFPLGTAFLVFFGNNEGCTVMDLPIKKAFGTQLEASGRLFLDDNAYIRIRVDVMPLGMKERNFFHPLIDLYSREMIDASAKARAEHDKKVLQPILEQLKKAGKKINRPKRDHRRTLRRQECPADEKAAREFPGSRIFCHMGILDIFSSMAAAMKCEDVSGFINQNTSMASTIATAASLEI